VIRAVARMREPAGPRILGGEGMLDLVVREGLPRATAARAVDDMVAMGAIERIRPGLYVNRLAPAPVADEELLHFLRPGAVVSLHSVLGRGGILSGAPLVVHGIVPVGRGDRPKLGTVQFGPRLQARIFAMPRELIDSEELRQMGAMNGATAYPESVPEKAMADWVYLASRPRTSLGMPPLDADTDLMDVDFARELAARLGVGGQLDAWLADKAEHDADPDVQANGLSGSRL